MTLSNTTQTYTATIVEENGEYLLDLGLELCAQMGWEAGDTIEWIDNGDGSWQLKKKNPAG